jgi:hypothetical protein
MLDPNPKEHDDEEISLADTEADLTMLQESIVDEGWMDDAPGDPASKDETDG